MAMSKEQWAAYWASVNQGLAAAPRVNLDRGLAGIIRTVRELREIRERRA